MLTQEEIDEWQLPEWARCKANGDYTLPNAALPTKDGRRTGNAVTIGLSDKQWPNCKVMYLVITDAGNVMRLLETELKELFHPPEFVMKRLLPTHIQALEALEVEQQNPTPKQDISGYHSSAV